MSDNKIRFYRNTNNSVGRKISIIITFIVSVTLVLLTLWTYLFTNKFLGFLMGIIPNTILTYTLRYGPQLYEYKLRSPFIKKVNNI